MVSFSFFPDIKCIFLEPYTLEVKQANTERYPELYYKSNIIKISDVNVDELITECSLTEIENSSAKVIKVCGSLFLHDCPDEIESISASGDVYLFNCAKVNHISAGRFVTITYLPDRYPICRYREVVAQNLTHQQLALPNVLGIHNCYSQEEMIIKNYFKIVEVEGDCSKIPKIIFTGESPEQQVRVKKGAHFYGEVVGGQLIYEV